MPTPHAYFQKQFMPLAEAKIGIMPHAFSYGPAVLEGIRGNWNDAEQQLYLFRLKEHYGRLRKSCRIMRIEFQYGDEELYGLTTRLVEMSGFREGGYIRPAAP